MTFIIFITKCQIIQPSLRLTKTKFIIKQVSLKSLILQYLSYKFLLFVYISSNGQKNMFLFLIYNELRYKSGTCSHIKFKTKLRQLILAKIIKYQLILTFILNFMKFIIQMNHQENEKIINEPRDRNCLSQIEEIRTQMPSESSIHQKEYLSIVSKLNSLPQQQEKDISTSLFSHGITFYNDRINNCVILSSSHHSNVLEAEMRLGNFGLKLTILNINKNSVRLSKRIESSFGIIFECLIDRQEVVIKQILFNDEQSKFKQLINALKEYSFLKICSALKCGPYTKNYLGFDVLVYEDCVEFLMEKIMHISEYRPKYGKDLLESLSILHYYHIIHFDIKPDNTGYSFIHKRMVFLDFGLTETIDEVIGFQTISKYRGSLSFCSSDMLNLFTSDKQTAKIDLYYNDAICLKNTLASLELNSSEMISQIIVDQDYSDRRQIMLLCKEHQLSQIKHLIYTQRYEKIESMIKKMDLDYVKEFLDYFKRIEITSEIKKIFNQSLAFLENVNQYEEMKIKFANSCRVSVLNKIQYFEPNQTERQDSILNIYENKYGIKINLNFNLIAQQNVNFLQKNLSEVFKNQEWSFSSVKKQALYSIFIYSLRFDTNIYKLSFEQKAKFARKFSEMIMNQQPNQSISELSIIRSSFIYLLNYCIELPYSQWKRNNIFLILMQCIILDCNILPMLQVITNTFSQLSSDMYYCIFHLIQIYRIERLLHFKHKSLDSRNLQSTRILIVKLIDVYIEHVKSNYQSSPWFQTINNLANRINQQEYQFGFNKKELQLELSKLQNKQIQQKLEYLYAVSRKLSTDKLKFALDYIDTISPYLHKHIFIDANTIKFNFGLLQFYNVIANTKTFAEIQKATLLMKEAIGCEELFYNFIFDMKLFIADTNHNKIHNSQKLKRYSLEIIQCIDMNMLFAGQFLSLWHLITLNQQFHKLYPDLLERYIMKIERICRNEESLNGDNQNKLIYEDSMIERAFYLVKDKKRFVDNISSKLLQIYQDESTEEDQRTFIRQRLDLFFVKIHMAHGNFVAAYNQCLKFYMISQQIQHESLMLHSCKILCRLSEMLGLEEQLEKNVINLYTLSQTSMNLTGFFSIMTRGLFKSIFLVINKVYGKEMSYKLLEDMAAFMTEYPLTLPFQFWIDESNKIKAIFPQIFRIEHLTSYFLSQISWSNFYKSIYYVFALEYADMKQTIQIVLKFSPYFERLKIFAKEFIQQKYYECFLLHIDKQKRRRNYVLLKLAKRFELSTKTQHFNQIRLALKKNSFFQFNSRIAHLINFTRRSLGILSK